MPSTNAARYAKLFVKAENRDQLSGQGCFGDYPSELSALRYQLEPTENRDQLSGQGCFGDYLKKAKTQLVPNQPQKFHALHSVHASAARRGTAVSFRRIRILTASFFR